MTALAQLPKKDRPRDLATAVFHSLNHRDNRNRLNLNKMKLIKIPVSGVITLLKKTKLLLVDVPKRDAYAQMSPILLPRPGH